MEDERMSLHSSSALPPLFTIEQIELIRRLRNSGITKQDVVYAFDSLDRLDSELGVLSKTTVDTTSLSAHKETAHQKNLTSSKTSLCQSLPISTQNGGHVIQSCDSNGFDLLDESCSNLSTHSSSDYSVQVHNVLGTPIRHQENTLHSVNPMHLVHSMSEEDYSEELIEFIKKGEDVICDEIRRFVLHNQITQSHIAQNSGISQSYVSRYLRGDYCDMSETSCRGVYLWYLKARKKNFIKSDSVIFTSSISGNSGDVITSHQTELTPLTCSSEALNYIPHRRERFTFRPCHLQVLETYFSQNQYPSSDKREVIATACNEAFSAITPCVPLTDREKVYPNIVTTWFSNRRKELKKINKDGGPGNSPNHLTGRSSWRSTSMESLNSSPLSDDKQLSSLNQLDCKQLTLNQLDSQSLSMAVEVAAVNQAILSLTG